MRANVPISNFVGGELSPLMYGRSELPIFKRGVARAQNFIMLPQGGGQYRSGTVFVGYTRLNKTGVFIPFQFNDQQSYLVEATDQKFRFYKDNGIITEAAKTITGISQANPGKVTIASHGYSNGDEVALDSIGGMTQLNGKRVLVANKTSNDFDIVTADGLGTNINTTGYTAYSSGGTASRIHEVTTPYLEADLPFLQYTQNFDTMYITHQNYEPRKLTRSGHASWSLATFSRTADPFTTSTKYPRAVTFTDDGRLLYGGTKDNPETLWGSMAPSTGSTRYDNFTTGTNATDAVIFTLAPVHGKADTIEWLSNTDKFIIAGTFGTVRRIYGGSEAEPITPNAITAKSVNNYGCHQQMAVTNGTSMFYIQRGQQILRSFEYDYVTDGYVSTDRNLVADHLMSPGARMITDQQGRPDVLWSVREDGILLGLTYKEKEDISGWHRQRLGGYHRNTSTIDRPWGKVLWVGTMPRPTSSDQLWHIVERRINGMTVRSVEYTADMPVYPEKDDFFTDEDSEAADTLKYKNALYEKQKSAIHLDMALSYDGSSYGTAAGATVTPGAATGVGVTFTASAAVFTAAMVGREIWKKYDENGDGGGRAKITAYTNSTNVVCEILSDFNNTNAIPVGSWFLTTANLSGLNHLEGETVQIITDGGPHNDVQVSAGALTLEYQASRVHVGYGYLGMLKTLNLDIGGVSGSAQSKPRNLVKTAFRFVNTLGCKFGTDLYKLERLVFRSTADIMGRPTPLYNGLKEQPYQDSWQDEGKAVIIVQDLPLPCTVLVMDAFMETTDE